MSLFAAVGLYVIGREAAAESLARGVAAAACREDLPPETPTDAWRRWWSEGTGAGRSARERRLARRRAATHPVRPRVRARP